MEAATRLPRARLVRSPPHDAGWISAHQGVISPNWSAALSITLSAALSITLSAALSATLSRCVTLSATLSATPP